MVVHTGDRSHDSVITDSIGGEAWRFDKMHKWRQFAVLMYSIIFCLQGVAGCAI